MPTLESSIALYDDMTPQLTKIEKTLLKTADSCDSVKKNAERMDVALGKANNGLAGLEKTSTKTGHSFTVLGFNISGVTAKIGMLSAAGFGLFKAFQGVAWIFTSGMGMADEFAQTTARINLMNDGLQSTARVQEMILASAMETGSKYADTADFVAKLGLLSGNAFANTRKTVDFAEQISKHLAIAGTSGAAAAGSMLQLQQALSMGVLRGQELNSVMQGMPTVIQAIEKKLGVSRATLRAMANDGLLSADIVKDAVFEATEEINKKFAAMPITFSSAFNMIGGTVQSAFAPVWQTLTSISNNGDLKAMLAEITPVLSNIATGLAIVVTATKNFVGVVVPLIGSSFRTAGTIVTNAINAIGAAFTTVFPVAIGLLAGYSTYMLLANAGTIANGALTLGLIAIHKTRNAVLLATIAIEKIWAVVTGGVSIANAILAGTIWGVLSPVLLVYAAVGILVGAFAIWATAGGKMSDVLATAFEYIVDATEWLVNSSVKLINVLIGAYNSAGSVLGRLMGYEFAAVGTVDYTADYSAFKDKYAGAIRDGEFMETLSGDMKSLLPKELTDGLGGGTVPNSAELETAKNTKGIKDAMDIMEEDLKYLNDIAEREYTQNYQHQTIKVDMSGMQNTITKEADGVDIVKILKNQLEEESSYSTEGAYT